MKNHIFLLLIGLLLVSCQTDEEKAEEAFEEAKEELNAGDTAAALVYLTEAIELDPKNEDYLDYKAYTHYKLGEYERAIEEYSALIESGHSASGNWNILGISFAAIGEPKKAIDAYTEAIEIEPNKHIFWYNRALNRKDIGDYEGAMNDLTEAIELNPKSSHSWNQRGMLHYDLNNYRSAIYDFSKAIEIEPTNATCFSNRAYAKRANGDQEGACADARVAQQLGKDIDISEYCD
jgi:tetratricopeptide (TPR) repeat protein